jgi:hypothetical protein
MIFPSSSKEHLRVKFVKYFFTNSLFTFQNNPKFCRLFPFISFTYFNLLLSLLQFVIFLNYFLFFQVIHRIDCIKVNFLKHSVSFYTLFFFLVLKNLFNWNIFFLPLFLFLEVLDLFC